MSFLIKMSNFCQLTPHGLWSRSFNTNQRKTFKKLYEQKELVRNTKDQISAESTKIWENSHQRCKVKSVVGDHTFDFFDVNPGKVLPTFAGRFPVNSTTELTQVGVKDVRLDIMENTFHEGKANKIEIEDSNQTTRSVSSPTTLMPNFIKINQVKLRINRKNTVKITNVSRFGNDTERSVVNVASDKFHQHIKIKTLVEWLTP